MVVNHFTNARQRTVPRSNLPRTSAFGRKIAAWHDAWLQRRAALRWAHELDSLDARTLRDIGLNHSAAGDMALSLRGEDRTRAEITFLPHYLQGVAKVATHLEG